MTNVIEQAKSLLAAPSDWMISPETDADAPIRCLYYHQHHPEFTVRLKVANQFPKTLEWMRGEVVKTTTGAVHVFVYWMETPIDCAIEVMFDDAKKRMVNPEWAAVGSGRLYYYDRESMAYYLRHFLVTRGGHSVDLMADVDIPVSDKTEVNAFIHSTGADPRADPESDLGRQYELWLHNTREFNKWRTLKGQR